MGTIIIIIIISLKRKQSKEKEIAFGFCHERKCLGAGLKLEKGFKQANASSQFLCPHHVTKCGKCVCACRPCAWLWSHWSFSIRKKPFVLLAAAFDKLIINNINHVSLFFLSMCTLCPRPCLTWLPATRCSASLTTSTFLSALFVGIFEQINIYVEFFQQLCISK